MKKKTIILIAWPLSVLIGVWLGSIAGVKLGMEIGRSNYHNKHIRRLYIDLGEASKSGDQRTREVLDMVSELVSTIGEPAYEKESKQFAANIKDLQAGADQPATKPADKVPAKDQPSTPHVEGCPPDSRWQALGDGPKIGVAPASDSRYNSSDEA